MVSEPLGLVLSFLLASAQGPAAAPSAPPPSTSTSTAAAPASAAAARAAGADPSVRSGKYQVTLRVPPDGVYAEEETQIEFRIVDATSDDPVLGPTGVIRATIASTISMPSMPGMPKAEELAHVEGVPGDYGIHPVFPHGGDYVLALRVAPPAGEPFTVEFPLSVKDADPSRPPRPKPFSVELDAKPGKPKAGERVALRFTVRERDVKEIVKTFDVMHEKLVHLIVVREDLGFFSHEHPAQQSDGTFALDFTFPTEGTYHLFADLAPRGRGGQVLLATLDVKAGKKDPKVTPYVLSEVAGAQARTTDGLKISMATEPAILRTRANNTITFTVVDEKTGAAVTDLEPYLGAMGHLVLINQDGTTYVHSHPDENAPRAREGVVPFSARFAKPGLYRAWGQFQRGGKIVTADFVVSVK